MVCPMAPRLKANRVDGGIDFRHAQNLCDQFFELVTAGEIDRFETHRLRMLETVFIHIADQYNCGAEDPRRTGSREPNRACAGHVNC